MAAKTTKKQTTKKPTGKKEVKKTTKTPVKEKAQKETKKSQGFGLGKGFESFGSGLGALIPDNNTSESKAKEINENQEPDKNRHLRQPHTRHLGLRART